MDAAADKFWIWFKEHNKEYLFLDSVEESVKENLLDDFLNRLHDYCDQLYFEIGGFPDEDQELIITADGQLEYFTAAETLVMPNLHRSNHLSQSSDAVDSKYL